MRAKSLLKAGALMLSLCLTPQLAQAGINSGSDDGYRAQPAARIRLAYGGGVPGPMVEDLRRGRRYDGNEYYDERSGRWRQGYTHRHRHRQSKQDRLHPGDAR
jgi:hypothetical protein